MGKPRIQVVGATKKNPQGIRPQDDSSRVPESLRQNNGEEVPVAKVGPGDSTADPRLKELSNLDIKVGDATVTAFPHTFSTGSFGWLAVQRTMVQGRPVQATVTIVISGSKDAKYAKK